MKKSKREFFEEAFRGYNVPLKIRKISENICKSFHIKGICDPMYISNTIAYESGSGNGKGTFINDEIKNTRKIAEKLQYAYGCNIPRQEINRLEKIITNSI